MTDQPQHEPDNVNARPPSARRAFHSPVAWLTLVVTLALGLTADLWSKSYAFENIGDEPVVIDRQRVIEEGASYDPIGTARYRHVTIIPGGILDGRLVINHGAVFGIGQEKREFFVAFTMVALVVGVLVFSRWTLAQHHTAHVAIGMILAGGLGNLYDRIVYAVVRDFCHLLPNVRLPFGWRWPGGGSTEIFPWVFNVADVLLLTGMVLLMVHINVLERRRRRKEALAAEVVEEEAPMEPADGDVDASALDTSTSR